MSSKLGHRIWALMVSRRFAVILLALVVFVLAISSFFSVVPEIPAEGVPDMNTGRSRLYDLGLRFITKSIASSYVIGLIGIFLILSTFFCALDRMVNRYKDKNNQRPIMPDVPPNTESKKLELRGLEVDKAAEAASLFLRFGRLWRVHSQKKPGGVRLAAYRGEWGFWGSVLFHAILIIALGASVAYYLGGYRASFIITEGQTVRLSHEAMKHIDKEPVWGLGFPDYSFTLVFQETRYAEDDPWYPLEHIARLKVDAFGSQDSSIRDLRINDPFIVGGKKFLLIRGGYSPRIVLSRTDGTVLFDSFVALTDRDGTSDAFNFRDINGNGLVFASLFSDYFDSDGLPGSLSPQPRNPVLSLVARDDQGQVLLDDLIALGAGASSGGYIFSFPELRKWVHLEMVGEPGIGFFFYTCFVGIVGIVIRFMDPDDALYLDMTDHQGMGCTVKVTGVSRHFQGLLMQKATDLLRVLSELDGGGEDDGNSDI